MKKKFTIKEFNEKYKNDDDCLHQIFLNKYANQKTCSKCGKDFKYYRIRLRKCYGCSYCGNQLHPLSNTIFHKSSTSLKSWFYAIFLFSVSKNGVSSKELQRHIGVTYKCAWRISKQIRKLLSDGMDNLKLKGLVEIDEAYIGGKESNKHKDKKISGNKGRSTKTKSLTRLLG